FGARGHGTAQNGPRRHYQEDSLVHREKKSRFYSNRPVRSKEACYRSGLMNAWKTRTPSSRGSRLEASTSAGTKVLFTSICNSVISLVPSWAILIGIFSSTICFGTSVNCWIV